jgi:hypothetical protein
MPRQPGPADRIHSNVQAVRPRTGICNVSFAIGRIVLKSILVLL